MIVDFVTSKDYPEHIVAIGDIIALLGVLGGIVLFGRAIYEWRDAQQWKRAEKLEALIGQFETEPLLKLGRTVVDWERRHVVHESRPVTIRNKESLLALRIHTELDANAADVEDREYRGEQPLIRDSLDALLNFFDRLAIAVSTRLVDADHARLYFRYWLWKLVTYNAHPIKSDAPARIKSRGAAEDQVAKYIAAYGNIELVLTLCRLFGVPIPAPLENAGVEELRRRTWSKPELVEDRSWF